MTGRRIVTLLTDFGEGSYVPSMKGVLLGLAPDAVLVDITHDVIPGAVGPAAHLLRHTASFFPPGTIHLAVVDPGVGSERLALIVGAGGSLFVGPDNGIFGELLRGEDVRAWTIGRGSWLPAEIAPTFHGRDLFARVAGGLARGDPPDRFGSPVDPRGLVPSPIERPTRAGERLSGEVVWIDRFGSLITNMERSIVDPWASGLPYAVRVGEVRVDTRVRTFADARPGDLVFLFGSWGTLEIAVVRGSASGRLGVSIGEPVQLERIHES